MRALENQAGQNADAKAALDHGDGGQVIHHPAAGAHVQAVLGQERLNVRVGGVVLHDERMRAHLLHRDDAGRMRVQTLGHHAHQPVAVERMHLQFAGALGGQKAQVHHAGPDPVDHVGVGALIDLDLHARVLALVRRHDLRQPRHADAVERADLDRAALHALELVHRLGERLVGIEHLADDGIERLAAPGERHAALAAHEQRKAAGLLHGADGVADRAGREMEHLRRAGKAALLDHRMENSIFQQRHERRLLSAIPFTFSSIQMNECIFVKSTPAAPVRQYII